MIDGLVPLASIIVVISASSKSELTTPLLMSSIHTFLSGADHVSILSNLTSGLQVSLFVVISTVDPLFSIFVGSIASNAAQRF